MSRITEADKVEISALAARALAAKTNEEVGQVVRDVAAIALTIALRDPEVRQQLERAAAGDIQPLIDALEG